MGKGRQLDDGNSVAAGAPTSLSITKSSRQ